MPLHVRTGTAFRWRPTALPGQPADVLRVLELDGVQLALLANGYECDFSTCWPPASSLILDLFVDEWSASSGSVRARLDAAFNRARRRFIERASSLIKPDPDFPDDAPAATLLAVAIEGPAVHMAWIGGDIALVARGFSATASTTPHTLVERFKHEHPEVTDLSEAPNVLLRSIAKYAPQDPPGYLASTVEAGDTLLLLSRSALRGASGSIDDAAFAAAGYARPTVLAERLAEVAFAKTDAPYAAVVALRFDDVDLGSTIDQLIDSFEPDPRHGEWVRTWSKQERALPVVFDMGGILGMKRDGAVISVPWDEPHGASREERSSVAHMAAVIGAAQKYPELKTLAPARPSNAADCPQCAVLHPDASQGCPVCWQLGWLPPTPPSWWFSHPAPSVSTGTSATLRPWWRKLLGQP